MNIATAVPQAIAPLHRRRRRRGDGRVHGPLHHVRCLRVRGCSRGRPSESSPLVPIDLSTKPAARRAHLDDARRVLAVALGGDRPARPGARRAPPAGAAPQHARHAAAGRGQADPGRVEVGAGALGAGCGARAPRLPRRARVHAARGALARRGLGRASADRGRRGRLPDRRPRRDRPAGRVAGARRAGDPDGRLASRSSTSSTRSWPRMPGESIRLCLELDSSWNSPVLGHIGVWRSPSLHAGRGACGRGGDRRGGPGFALVGMMGYEAQIAGQGDKPARPAGVGRDACAGCRRTRRPSSPTDAAQAVASVREVADLEFVNGGGTGSLEFTASDDVGHRDRRRQRPVRRPPVRQLPVVPSGAGRGVRALGRAPARTGHRDAARRRLDRIRPARGTTGCPQVAWPTGLTMVDARDGGRGADAAHRRSRCGAARRRPGVAAAHEVGRAERARERVPPGRHGRRPRDGGRTRCPATAARERSSCDGDRGRLAQLGPDREGAARRASSARRAPKRCSAPSPRRRGRGCASKRSAPATASRASPSHPGCSSTSTDLQRRDRRRRRARTGHARRRDAPAPAAPPAAPVRAGARRTWATSTGRRSRVRRRRAPTAPAEASAASRPRSSALTLVNGAGRDAAISETQNAELLPAARLGLGALGVIVDITVQCVPALPAEGGRAAGAAAAGARLAILERSAARTTSSSTGSRTPRRRSPRRTPGSR